jgi:UDP-GlcNAc:undecaprenyl-phosphate GlcNAc-1-phosphate transferase
MGYQLLPLFISLVLSISLGYPAIFLAKRFNLLDVPGSAPHKAHARTTPLAGGILIVFVFTIILLLFRMWINREALAVLIAAFFIFVFGIWDDRRALSAVPKLIGQFSASAFLILAGVQVHFMTILSDAGFVSAWTAQALNVGITLMWLVGITNAMNMVDSMDGIVAGLGAIASAFFWGAAILAGQQFVAFWSAVLLGTCIGLYFWNKIRAELFLGDSGSQTIGFLLASFGILYNPLDRNPESSWIVPIMLLAVPIFDTTLVMYSRFKRKQSIWSGRLDHTYHRLIALGNTPGAATMLTHLTALTIGILAYATLYFAPIYALTCFLITWICGLILLLWMEKQPTLEDLNDRKEE